MPKQTELGIVLYALSHHAAQGWGGRHAGLDRPLALLEEARRLGAGGVQCPLTAEDIPVAAELRRRAEAYGMYVEASLNPPRDEGEVGRFEREVAVAQAAGAKLGRTVILPGRRYEEFRSLASFREAEARGLEALRRAAPVLARHRFRLAVENHKDQRIVERLETLRRVESEWVGMCVDVGNSFALMEDPMEVVRAYAPWAMTVHLKDQGLQPTEDGFLFADLPLGEGFLDLPAMVEILRQAQPGIRFNLETITRDALRVPVLRPEFWAALGDVPAAELGRTLRVVRQHAHPGRFPEVSHLDPPARLQLEEHNVRTSLAYARDRLQL